MNWLRLLSSPDTALNGCSNVKNRFRNAKLTSALSCKKKTPLLLATFVLTLLQLSVIDVVPQRYGWNLSNAIFWTTLTAALFASALAMTMSVVLIYSFVTWLWTCCTVSDRTKPPHQLK
jgi:hypothetical protein